MLGGRDYSPWASERRLALAHDRMIIEIRRMPRSLCRLADSGNDEEDFICSCWPSIAPFLGAILWRCVSTTPSTLSLELTRASSAALVVAFRDPLGDWASSRHGRGSLSGAPGFRGPSGLGRLGPVVSWQRKDALRHQWAPCGRSAPRAA